MVATGQRVRFRDTTTYRFAVGRLYATAKRLALLEEVGGGIMMQPRFGA